MRDDRSQESEVLVVLLRSIFGLTLFAAVTALPAWAGPPLICHAIDIGAARSLPWIARGSWDGTDPSYDVSRLVDDTLAILSESAPASVRMETLRRAVIYSARVPGLSDRLMNRLMARALSSQAAGHPDAQALFEAGYAIETVRQAAWVYGMLHEPQRDGWFVRTDPQIDGWALMRTSQQAATASR